MQSTIASIITPPGNSGVGIIRLSGTDALAIAKKLLHKPVALKPRVATVVTVKGEKFSDTALAIYFKSPNSFTGEDVVELQCHGGYFLLQKVLEETLHNGAVAAEPGEFSRRAFLNGKLSLDQAEAIIDIINAESDLQLSNANKTFSGNLRTKLDKIEQSLIQITAQIEATLDYPEHDIEHATVSAIRAPLAKINESVKSLIETAKTGRIVANGINVAMLGKPNVGKSSLFNALINSDRSIVTDLPGTTTDTITEGINYNGLKIIFHDTAGLREEQNKIESLGIDRTKKAIQNCDVVLAVFDAADKTSEPDSELLNLIKEKPCLTVYNKNDLVHEKSVRNDAKKSNFKDILFVSAKTGENIGEIKKRIYDKVVTSLVPFNKVLITNIRHLKELSLSSTALDTVLAALDTGTSLDCIAADIQTAVSHIGNITGTHASEAVLDEIFARFCLGK